MLRRAIAALTLTGLVAGVLRIRGKGGERTPRGGVRDPIHGAQNWTAGQRGVVGPCRRMTTSCMVAYDLQSNRIRCGFFVPSHGSELRVG